jgi:hypothetical protein
MFVSRRYGQLGCESAALCRDLGADRANNILGNHRDMVAAKATTPVNGHQPIFSGGVFSPAHPQLNSTVVTTVPVQCLFGFMLAF